MSLKVTFQLFFLNKAAKYSFGGKNPRVPHDKSWNANAVLESFWNYSQNLLIWAWLVSRILIFAESALAYIWQQGPHARLSGKNPWGPHDNLKSNFGIGKPLKFYIKNVTPVAGRIFATKNRKNRAIFLQRFFGRGISGEALLVYNFVPSNWLWIHKAGRRTDFWDQKSSDIFRRDFFGRGISGETLLVYNFVPINWLWSGFIYPRIRTFVKIRFHGLFSKKKRSKSGGVPSFPRREHVPVVISLPSG